MDDLRQRFTALDRIPVPDVWIEIEHRLEGLETRAPTRRLVAVTPKRSLGLSGTSGNATTFGDRRGLWMLVAALIAAALVGGVLAVGSGLVRVTSVTPAPPSPETRLTTSPSPSTSTSQPVPTSASWSATGTMTQFRDFAMVAGLMSDGRVLVVGGHGSGERTDTAMRSADLYDPASGQWTATGPLQSPHWGGHTVTPLPDGTVLLAGGNPLEPAGLNPGPTGEAELFDPGSGRWIRTGSMTVSRTRHLATLLRDGSVLVVGGDIAMAGHAYGTGSTRTAEIFDPNTGTWARTASMTVVRVARFATTLPDGRVLVIGDGGPADASFDAVEVYDPSTRTWTGGPTSGHGDCGGPIPIVRLSDGRLLGLCGTVFQPDSIAGSAALFDLATATWTSTEAPIRRLARTATLLADGRVLVSDDGAGQLHDPTTGKWTSAGLPSYPANRSSGFRMSGGDNTFWYEIDTATLLRDGRVLMTIGPSALLYDPAGQP